MPEFVMEPDPPEYAKIKVIGVGGGGCNAVDWMFEMGLQNIEFYTINTDAQALRRYKCPNKIQIGTENTRGRGCGGNPEIGRQCMEEAKAQIEEILRGADIVFVTSGLGGGTGTGGAPIVANIARSMDILTVGVVTRPFRFEGPRRSLAADQGIERLRKDCDTIIVVSNDRLIEVAGAKATLREAFGVANNVLAQAVQSISDLVTVPGLINVDFNDIRAVMGNRGGAVMGVGVGKGENRSAEAVRKATQSPLLEKIVIDGASGVLVNITGGSDMTLGHVNEAMAMIYDVVDTNAMIIFGAVLDESIHDEMRVTIIATGFPDDPHHMLRDEDKAAASSQAVAFSPAMASHPRRPHIETPSFPPAMPKAPEIPAEIATNPIFADVSPVEPAPLLPASKAPAAPANVHPQLPPAPSARGTRSGMDIREALKALDADENTAPPVRPTPAAPTQRSAHPQSAPAMPAPQAPAVRPPAPFRRPTGSGDTTPGFVHPEHNALRDSEEKPKVSIFDPTKSAPAEVPQSAPYANDDYEVPAFIRRRGSALFND
jgi:cell division protein FtsZ